MDAHILRRQHLCRLLKASAAISMLVLTGVARGQSTLDNDPDMAPGFTNSVFHTPSVDSINLYNGQLTIPLAIGPSYPLGPKLKFQAVLTYNSYGWDYPYSSQLVGPFMAGDTAFGIGWSFTLGAIKNLNVGLAYIAPDGSQHVFSAFGTAAGYYKTTDATSFYLHSMGTNGWEMWDGDGNHYVFGQPVTGYDDAASDFRHDYGRGRNGWYLSQLTDPFGNGFSASYPPNGSISSPCWVIVNPYCPPPEAQYPATSSTQSKCNLSGAHWVPQTIYLTSGATISIGRKSTPDVGSEAGLIGSFTFEMPVNGTQTTRTWNLDYQATSVPSACGQGNYNTYRLSGVRLPNDLAGSPTFHFDYTTCPFLLMSRMTLPTGGAVDYAWGGYNFYHGRYIGMCSPSGIPQTAPVRVSEPVTCGTQPDPQQPNFTYVGFDCSGGQTWLDSGTVGVIARTETDAISGLSGTTTYTQYAFPFGEHDTSQTASHNSQSLTVVVFPPDANGKQRSKSILFYAGSTGDTTYPGDRTGADIREADYDFAVQAYARPISQPVCNGTTDRDFCPNHAFRVTQRTFDYDASAWLANRHLQSETKIFGATNALGQCATCLYHSVSYSNTTGRNWDAPTNDSSGNGRHYNVETHGGNLGGDFRQIVTTWKPNISPWFPNLFDKRITSDSTGSLNEYFDYDHGASANGFLRGTLNWDSGRSLLFGDCRYTKTSQGVVDSHGNVASRYTGTFGNWTSEPASNSCSALRGDPALWGGSPGNGDVFATDYTFQNGQRVSARPVNGSSRGGWLKYDVTRDSKTGWITSSRDTAGLQTSYLYDSLGRPTSITPPGEVPTAVTYDSPTQTTAVRNGSGSDSSTWSQFQYDGFGRTIRERRLMPGSSYAKRFTKFDRRGYAYFQSEWVVDSFGEAITADVGANCVFSGSSYPTNVPSSAPGLYHSCFDPFGRPQLSTGAGYSSQVTVSRSDSRPSMTAAYYSDTNEVSTVACVNGTFTSTLPHCTGGADATTTSVKDAFGRGTSVTEPSGDVTSYRYDILDKLTSVAQGAQSGSFGRTFSYDRFGFLRSERTPEKGTVTYDTIGSLGNVLQQTEPGSLVLSRSFDYAGRLTGVSSNEGRTYVTNTFDQSGRGNSLGKLTTSVSTNYALSTPSTVTDSFWYLGVGGRLSTKSEALGGSASFTATQTFGYNSLGLLSSHAHPRSGADPALNVSWTFNAGLPVSELVNGATIVSGIGYQPSGAVASYTTNNGPGRFVTTTISQDGNLPRPSRIRTSGASSNFDSGIYAYDGPGNIRAVGTDTFGYDALSRLTTANLHDDAGTNHQETFNYDRYGNTSLRTIDGGNYTFDIDPNTNRLRPALQTQYDPRGNLTLYGASNYSYDGLSRQTSYKVTGAVDERYLYDASGERVARFTPGATRASGGNFYTVTPCRVIDTRGGSGPVHGQTTRTFAANNCGIPANATTLAANVTSANVTSAGFFRVFPAGIALPTSTTNPLRVGQNRAVQAFVSINGPTPGSFSVFGDYPAGYTADFILDVSGYFVQQTATTQDTYSLTLRDPQNRLAAKYNLSGGVATLDKDYVYLGNQLVATWQPSAGYSFFMTDHLGTPRLQTDVNANVVTRAKNRAFGLTLTGSLPQQGPEYAAMEKDTASGNHYDHARFYTGWQGRFQVPDLLGGKPEDPQSWNRYAYARNNPLRYVDPDGRESGSVIPYSQCPSCAFTNPPLKQEALVWGGLAGAALLSFGGVAAVEGLGLLAPAVPSIAERAQDIQNALTSPVTRDRVTTAVATVENAAGEVITKVASSEKVLRPAQIQALRAGEQAVRGVGHAEATIINSAKAAGETVKAVAASRPICPACARLIQDAGAKAVTVIKTVLDDLAK